MEDPGKVIVAIVALIAFASVIRSALGTLALRWRSKGEAGSGATEANARLSRLEHAVDAIAVEVERISEGQRFTTRLLSDQARQSRDAAQKLPSHTPT